MKPLSLILLMLCLISTQAFSAVKIKNIDFKSDKHRGSLTIDYTGTLRGDPELKIMGKTIQVYIPNSKVVKTIEKSVSFSSKMKDTVLKAYQSTKSKSKIKANFAFNMENRSDLVDLMIRDNKIELNFPRVTVTPKRKSKHVSKKSSTKKKAKVKKEFLDEAYLNNLLKIEGKEVTDKAETKPLLKRSTIFETKEDEIKTGAAAPLLAKNKTEKKSNFDLAEYIGKFVAFLGLVLLLFYGVVTLMKKGFIKKGKLGFLNNTDQVSIISTTYVAPKKSLLLVKAHNQVFLVSNSDAGIHPISEIRDVAGLFKTGERALSGQNFDTNLVSANQDEYISAKVKLKDDIKLSNQASSKSSYKQVKEKVKFSDQLKKKVQSLKPLQ